RRARTGRTENTRHRGGAGDVGADLVLRYQLLDLVRIHGLKELEIAGVARFVKEETDVVAHAVDERVLPDFGWLQEAAIDLHALVRLAVDQENAAAVGGGIRELLLHRLEAFVVLLAEGLVGGAV